MNTDTLNKLPDASTVSDFFVDLQDRYCAQFEALDGKGRFGADEWDYSSEQEGGKGGGGNSRVMSDGTVFEKIGVNYSRISGTGLPAAATAQRPDLAGKPFRATGLSVVAHAHNPHVPTAHCNMRFFIADETGKPMWWFGGGFDLTPVYPVYEDVIAWHRTARTLCAPFGDRVYPEYKKQCDEYFNIRHRGETRGVGGLFFEDLNEWGFESCFAFVRAVGEGFIDAYTPIVMKRRTKTYDERQKRFQLLRRGRYAEFNLVYDRGTLFGLQSGGRIESVLMSLPPRADWPYNRCPEDGSAEAKLSEYLRPRDWLGEAGE